jgi:hypothetical protein
MQNLIQSNASHLRFNTVRLDFITRANVIKLPGASLEDPNAGFGLLINQILSIVLVIGVIAVLFYLIVGSVEWITSGGDKGKAEKARDKMTQAVIGLVILVSVFAIMMFIQQLLGICIINVAGSCQITE